MLFSERAVGGYFSLRLLLSRKVHYDENGLRVGKSGARNTEYIVVDGTYLGERTTIGSTEYLITYLYGDSGVIGIEVNGTKYFFVKNLQGDVTSIINASGIVMARYSYDAYGNVISATNTAGIATPSPTAICNLNPFRYRGYMYDQESGFYYLTSRYYDPAVGRFLNADGFVSTGSVSTAIICLRIAIIIRLCWLIPMVVVPEHLNM